MASHGPAHPDNRSIHTRPPTALPMTPQPIPLDVRDLQSDVARLSTTEKMLRAQNRALLDQLDTMKQRERVYVRTITQMLDTPATSVASVRVDNGEWEVIMNTGAVWRHVERVIHTDTEHRYHHQWMPRPAVPGSRAAIAQAVEDAEPVVPLRLLGDVA